MIMDSDTHNDFENQQKDKLGTGLSILSFCIPLAGAIIYFSNKSDKPDKAQQACHLALWGLALGFILNLIVRIIEIQLDL
jgi:hypothetical protein